MKKPAVYIVAGANGAGKTTFANEYLPDFVDCKEFLNADLIAAGLSPFAPESQNIRAGRLLLTRIRELVDAKQDFGFETTLSGRSYVRMLSEMRVRGYRVCMFFLWLPNSEMAMDRVANRVRQGGHNVPAEDIRRRYDSGLRNSAYRPGLRRISVLAFIKIFFSAGVNSAVVTEISKIVGGIGWPAQV